MSTTLRITREQLIEDIDQEIEETEEELNEVEDGIVFAEAVVDLAMKMDVDDEDPLRQAAEQQLDDLTEEQDEIKDQLRELRTHREVVAAAPEVELAAIVNSDK